MSTSSLCCWVSQVAAQAPADCWSTATLAQAPLAAGLWPGISPGHLEGPDLPGSVQAARRPWGLKRACVFGSQKRNFRKGFKLVVARTKLPETQKTSTWTTGHRVSQHPRNGVPACPGTSVPYGCALRREIAPLFALQGEGEAGDPRDSPRGASLTQ